MTADLFADSVQSVDGYHACRSKPPAVYTQAQTTVDQAEAWAIAAQLQAANLPDHAHYFCTDRCRMDYQEFDEQGYPSGSGTIESGTKQFKARPAVLDLAFDRLGSNAA